MKTVYLGLGSNVGDREANLRAAAEALSSAGISVLRASPIYETEPVDYLDQRWFLNQALEAETALFPMQLVARIGKIERAMGRVRGVPKGPRIIDIDILLYGNAMVNTPALTIPHASMAERRFVLAPLADLVPELRHPVLRKTIKELLDAAPQAAVRRLKTGAENPA
jgi:2-amino-4-hydroxy-6-hydroxymethyldihydropteridine diphosphokinase